MATFTIQMEQVDYIVGEMNSISQRIQQTLATLDDEAKMNLSEWSSSARDTYQQARDALNRVSVAPGAFYHANQIRKQVSGENGDNGLKGDYLKVLDDLAGALTDLRDGVRQLSQKYKTIEDANGMKAKDLQEAM